jgi:penicillin G amidase
LTLNSKEILTRLGSGEPIATVCDRAGWSRPQFDHWWSEECDRRVPAAEGHTAIPGPRARVQIRRDPSGIPHIEATTDAGLFFGFGYATAQDRLFQLDWFRRKAHGRLAEILGPEGVESDRLYRTLDLSGIARREWETLPLTVRDLLAAYTAGINAVIASGAPLPIEFDLLDYRPESWSPIDSLALAGEFRWYLTGRFPVIAIPEMVKRSLGDGPLYRAFLQGEADDEAMLPPSCYPSRPRGKRAASTAGGEDGPGSNNWVLAGSRTITGEPIVANDPHVPFEAVSIWHEVHLHGGSFNVAGVAYAGMPAVMIGRTEGVAWGITNNICSLRDLYLEKTDPQHPNCFLHDGQWEPADERREVIQVRGSEPVVETIRSSRNGPIVDQVLPGPARGQGPVTLRWQGAEPCGWLTALIGMNQARTAEEFRAATAPWLVPTFNLVFADTQGHIGHQSTGRIPVRELPERGYRPGWDPRHQWAGVIPFEEMPRQSDPKRGFVVTANNRLAGDDYPWPLSGTWSSGHRGRRIRERLEGQSRWSAEDCRNLQLDIRSGRAAVCVPPLLDSLVGDPDHRVQEALTVLTAWDYRSTPDSVAAALFNVFFPLWCRAVMAARVPADVAAFAAPNAGGLAAALLANDEAGWFSRSDRREAVRATFRAALDELARRLGPDMKLWAWGRLHTLVQKHYLSGRGDLGQLLDRSGAPAPGDGTTVCSTSSDPNHASPLGASYRMVADMADPECGMWAVSIPGESGHPGSPHYGDQVAAWGTGGNHYLSLKSPDAAWPTLTLDPVAPHKPS